MHARELLDGQRALAGQLEGVTADLADDPRGAAQRRQRIRGRGDDEGARALREGLDAGEVDARADPPAMQASAIAIATPPSATSCALDSAPARTVWRSAVCSVRSSPRSAAGSGPSIGSPWSLASSEAACEGAHESAATSATTSPSRAKPSGAARRASGSSPTIPTTGVG